MKRLALVTPWFGADLKGGAEQLAWQLAHRLATPECEVHVITTCCASFLDDWSVNTLPAGKTSENGIVVHRFPVDPRNTLKFDLANGKILQLNGSKKLYPGTSAISQLAASAFLDENIHSTELIEFLRQEKATFNAFVFLPYLYGPIYRGVAEVADKAVLVPCLHDEVYAYLPEIAEMCHSAGALAFNSEGEMELATRMFGPAIIRKSLVAGCGIEMDFAPPASRPVDGRFILCLGRRTVHKNTDFLVSAFHKFRLNHPETDIKLVLAGPGEQTYHDPANQVFDLALVDEETKAALLRDCLALFHASENESYSRVMMEAWMFDKPVVAHSACLATSAAVLRCGGGLTAGPIDEWVGAFEKISTGLEQELMQSGRRGREYALKFADWNNVIGNYQKIFSNLKPPAASERPTGKIQEIHQLLVSLVAGDAISQQAIQFRDHWRQQGFVSEIFAESSDRKMRPEVRLCADSTPPRDACLLYHHSIGSSVTDVAIKHSGPKTMIYHNITPASFFQKYRPALARELDQGRRDLGQLAEEFPNALGDSNYNCQELLGCGFSDAQTVPIIVDPGRWQGPPDSGSMARLSDGRTNILFVGRIAPNKCQHDLLEFLDQFRLFDRSARLVLTGAFPRRDKYVKMLLKRIKTLGLKNHVLFLGHCSEAQLQAAYRTASLFVSMSEHEGFGVPLIESMWFDVPLLAFECTAVPETTGGQCVLFETKSDMKSLAACGALMVHDQETRRQVVAAQRKWREQYRAEHVLAALDQQMAGFLPF